MSAVLLPSISPNGLTSVLASLRRNTPCPPLEWTQPDVPHPGFNYPSNSLNSLRHGGHDHKEYTRKNDVLLREFSVAGIAQDTTEEARLGDSQVQADKNGIKTRIIGPTSCRNTSHAPKG